MSRFNKSVVIKRTVNRAGGEAFVQDEKHQLVGLLLTSMLKKQHYRSEDEQMSELISLIAGMKDKHFVAQAAVFARNEYGMRSISHIAAAEIGKQVKGVMWTKEFFRTVARRPDDVTEILAYFITNYGDTIPNAMKKGLGMALSGYDAYRLAKYRGEGRVVSLVDAVNLCHPKHTPQLKKLVAGKLVSKDTWESRLTQAGQQAESEEDKADKKAEAWADLIRTRKIGYFALLRNLRNIAQQSPEVLDEALALLVDEKLIRKSLVLPFRYTTAFEELQPLGNRNIISALSQALDISLANVPKFKGKTLVAMDGSGSMAGQPAKIGSLFAAVLYKANDADLITFESGAQYITPDPNSSTIAIADGIIKSLRMRGTDFRTIFNTANRHYDRIIILSDMQAWVGYATPQREFAAYTKRYEANPFIYAFDLQGYGTMQFPADRIFQLFGFSEKVFDVMQFIETDRNALIKRIEAISFD